MGIILDTASGHREINWDGGSPTNAATSLSGTPLTAFLNTRGANITTRGSGFVQAPASGLADTFGNSSYATIFHAFSPLRLFSPIGSNVTVVEFAVPGSNGNTPATTTGLGWSLPTLTPQMAAGRTTAQETVTPAR
jgi:hypothetical protein